jgi:carbamoyl-phosphate synthase large subunit
MPRRGDLKRIVILGAGPIVIGQACEFDYSGTQGTKALGEEGYEVILVNSNPATIMTDPELALRTYVEPLEPRTLTAILERERPSAILPTLGGQTALNLALAVHHDGTLARLGIEMLGASPLAIAKAEDRALFKEVVTKVGLESPRSEIAHTVEEAWAIVKRIGFPAILRPSFTLAGSGGGIAHDESELETKVAWALAQSPVHEVLIEESLLGWKEFELEVMRDKKDNFIVVCTIENIDPMGIHTGDSITVAPAMTLTDREYQRLRDGARAIMTEIGVETGGANVQFAVSPTDGRVRVIEMNPRVSRSSALASKATGYPIAKIAAKLAVGYTLDELRNDITSPRDSGSGKSFPSPLGKAGEPGQGTSAAFEPTIDYVVVKWPRFAFEKFPGADDTLGPQMKSVGEVMSIGSTFCQALQKAARSLETGRDGLVSLMPRVDYRVLARPKKARDLGMDAPSVDSSVVLPPAAQGELAAAVRTMVARPLADRLFYVADAMRLGVPDTEIAELTSIDPWFLGQMRRLVTAEQALAAGGPGALRHDGALLGYKKLGFSDAQIGALTGMTTGDVRALRAELGLAPAYSRVDTCAAELVAHTPYLYATYGSTDESLPTARRKVMILGGGPNRIGQGIEFDYCCVHAVQALRGMGFETIMVNCNPETVSTDYDTADKLYFEPLSLEDVLAVCDVEKPYGVVVQFGGQTPLKLALPLAERGIHLLGTSADAIDRAEDRGRFDELLAKLGLRRPRSGTARGAEEALAVADRIGYPVLVRPSYVLGGRAMMIAYTKDELASFVHLALEASGDAGSQVILVDEFLKDAMEIDVDAVGDGQRVAIGGVLQHLEEAGIHSGDSTSVLPPHSLDPNLVFAIEEQTKRLGLELGVVGLMNVQFAVKDDLVYVLEVNPRASRTVPFVSKATGRPLARIAAMVMAGKTLDELGVTDVPSGRHVAVKECVFPFKKLPGTDTILGPEMRSTGEVMGIAETFARAYEKALLSIGISLTEPEGRERKGRRAFISVKDQDKPAACLIARRLRAMGFDIVATRGTAAMIRRARIPCEVVNKVNEGSPHVVDALRARQVDVVVNTTVGAREVKDSYSLRRQALLANVPYFTTIAVAQAGLLAIESAAEGRRVRSLQEWNAAEPAG